MKSNGIRFGYSSDGVFNDGQPDEEPKARCKYCGEFYLWQYGYGKCLNNCEEEMELQKNNIRPISCLVIALAEIQKRINYAMFVHLFGKEGEIEMNTFKNFGCNLISYISQLNPEKKARILNYIEGQTINYDVEKNVKKTDIERLKKVDPNQQASFLRDLNWCHYNGTLDENSILMWLKKQ